jgi:C1A family cysteine protease
MEKELVSEKETITVSLAQEFNPGAEQSPPDERDWQIEELYEAQGIDPQGVSLPTTYVVPNRPPILNQGSTPQCVAYSTSSLKSYQDRDDQSPAKFWNFDESLFFRQIGGTQNGAYLRSAMDRLLRVGYPVVSIGQPSKHKIKSYYAVSKSTTAIKTAVKTYGEIVCAMAWYHSWNISPESNVNYIMRRPDYKVGGHAIVIDGWDDNRKALRLRNSFGSTWGASGDAFLPYAYMNAIWEIWKALDA